MLLRNDTPFAAIEFGDLHRDGAIMSVICVRASYDIGPNGALTLGHKQQVLLNDIYEGDPHRTPLLHVGDLIPYKPMADVTLLGSGHSPAGQNLPSWEVSISVGAHEASLRVHGPRRWEPTLKFLKPTWKLGPAELVNQVPLDYRLAAGGRFVGDPEGGSDIRNPIGRGILHKDWSRVGIPLPAPQIESLEDPVGYPFGTTHPEGFAPIPPFWHSREQFLGTRDEAWQRERMPQMPKDLSYSFYQTAHPKLIVPKVRGDARVRLKNLLPGLSVQTIELPGVQPVAHHQWTDGRKVSARLKLDGLHLDLRAREEPMRIDLTWRGWVARCPAYYGAALEAVPLAAAIGLLSYDEEGLIESEGVL